MTEIVNAVPTTDAEALRYLYLGLAARGWQVTHYEELDLSEKFDKYELVRIESVDQFIEAVTDVDEPVLVHAENQMKARVTIQLLAQGSPEDLVVDHTYNEEFAETLNALWTVFE